MSKDLEMTFIDHLEALRWALIRSIFLISMCMFGSFIYSNNIQEFIMKPLYDMNLSNFNLQDIKITSPFVVKVIIAVFIFIFNLNYLEFPLALEVLVTQSFHQMLLLLKTPLIYEV